MLRSIDQPASRTDFAIKFGGCFDRIAPVMDRAQAAARI
jgi:hypothetical protein